MFVHRFRRAPDESFFCRGTRAGVHFFDGTDVSARKIAQRLSVPNMTQFSISGSTPPKVATFTPPVKGAPASVKVFDYPSLKQVCAKSFFADKVEFEWASKTANVVTRERSQRQGADYLLATASCSRESSYYQTKTVHLLQCSAFGDTFLVKSDGGAYASAFVPTVNANRQGFIAISGVPTQPTFYGAKKCNEVFEFGAAKRNAIVCSPNGRYVVIGGFLGMSGAMDFWDLKTRQLLGTADDQGARAFEWSPDSKVFMTALLSPFRQVDNGIKLWSRNGNLLHHVSIERLFQASFVPFTIEEKMVCAESEQKEEQDQNHSAGSAPHGPLPTKAAPRTSAQKKAAYVPPGARRNVAGGKQAASQGSGNSGGSSNRRRRRGNKSKQTQSQNPQKQHQPKQAHNTQPQTPQSSHPQQLSKPPPQGSQNVANAAGDDDATAQREKLRRKLKKKLAQITTLEKKFAAGENLNQQQLEKLKQKNTIEAELKALS